MSRSRELKAGGVWRVGEWDWGELKGVGIAVLSRRQSVVGREAPLWVGDGGDGMVFRGLREVDDFPDRQGTTTRADD